MSKNIAILVGSFRKKAFSRSVANAAIEALPEGYTAFIPSLDKLPMFNQDYDDEGTTPEEWQVFREQIAAADAALFITPEYNRSFPAVLKNAIDIASRPYGNNLWKGKPAAIASLSVSRLGGALANHHIRQPLTVLGLRIMTSPELYLNDVHKLLDDTGCVTDADGVRHIKTFVTAFTQWIEQE